MPINNQYVKEFSSYFAEQQAQLAELAEQFSRLDAALSRQDAEEDVELLRALEELQQEHEEQIAALEQQSAKRIQAVHEATSASLDKASRTYHKQQHQVRQDMPDDEDYEGSVERAKLKTTSEVNEKKARTAFEEANSSLILFQQAI